MTDRENLIESLRDNFTPEGLVRIGSHIQGVGGEAQYLFNVIVEALGGIEAYNRILTDIEGE